jgi:putative ABC transport system permease protein
MRVRIVHLGHLVALAVRTVRDHWLRSALSALGVMAGVTAIVSVHGTINGVEGAFVRFFDSQGGNTILVTNAPTQPDITNPPETWPKVSQAEADFLEERLLGVRTVIPAHRKFFSEQDARDQAIEIGPETFPDVYIEGTTEHWQELGTSVEIGRALTAAEAQSGRAVAVVGADVFKKMRDQGRGLGGTISIRGTPITVIGIAKARGKGPFGSMDRFIVIPIQLFRSLLGQEQSVEINLVLPNLSSARTVAESATVLLRGYRQLKPSMVNNFAIETPEMGIAMYKDLTRLLYAVTTLLGLLTLVLAGASVMNIMLVSVSERTREIGILLALGATPSSILGQFLFESVVLSFVGALFGIGAGSIVVYAVSHLTPLPAHMSVSSIVVGVGYGVTAGIVFAFLPAWRASRLVPSQAIRGV